MNIELPQILDRVRQYATVPIAVGFGVANRGHFDQVAAAGADGVVIGSRIVNIIKNAPAGEAANAVEKYCREISLKGNTLPAKILRQNISTPLRENLKGTVKAADGEILLPGRFGTFGGQYVPEALVDCLSELEAVHKAAMDDPKFWAEFHSHYDYMNRPSHLYLAENLTKESGGANIWLKREDLYVHLCIKLLFTVLIDASHRNHTGSHKINNAVGQILLAKRLGKTRIVAETGAGQHGVATATVCAKFGLECVIYMGAEDVRRQALNVFRIEMLGAKVRSMSLIIDTCCLTEYLS